MTAITRILHLNVRLSEGGAAQVAQTLTAFQESDGRTPFFAYGYGPSGGPSPLAASAETHRITPRPLAAANLIAHRVSGREGNFASSRRLRALEARIEWADIVHLHAIHSYFLSTHRLFSLILRHQKPTVWTMHDQWAITGRCAQPGDCGLWRAGCPKCPTPSAYPPAYTGRTAQAFRRKSALIHQLLNGTPTRLVACASWLADDLAQSHAGRVSFVPNGVDQEFWNHSIRHTQRSDGSQGIRRVIFACRDLRDERKVNWALLRKIARLKGVRLTIVGDHPAMIPAGVVHLPAVNSRSEWAQILSTHDTLLFTSLVDYFPLTIAEAIVSGMTVAALESPAAREFLPSGAVNLRANTEGLLDFLATPKAAGPGLSARELYSPDLMGRRYQSLYESLI
jgi:putative colanic acid biosynthesis glycosyltransferase